MNIKKTFIAGISGKFLTISILGFLLQVLIPGCGRSTYNPPEKWVVELRRTAFPQGKIIFMVGEENRSDNDLAHSGFSDSRALTFTAGKDLISKTFPAHLHLPGKWEDHYDGVPGVTIQFLLKKNYDDLILRLARGGIETIKVSLDNERQYIVTANELGSTEGNYGDINLSLGPLNRGDHSLTFEVVDDNIGNGRFNWDYLALIGQR